MSDTLAYLTFLGIFLVSVTIFFGEAILSSVTLFVDLDREELSSMPVDKILMSIGVVDLGVTGFFGVPGGVSLGVTSEVFLRVPDGYLFTLFCPNLLSPNH